MKEVTSHKVNGLNEALKIHAVDEAGSGGAYHDYLIMFKAARKNDQSGLRVIDTAIRIQFQKRPIKEAGVNGISNEALLAIVEDRLKDFQSGEYKCRENACALTHLQEAMMWLHRRTHERMQRGVEGTMAK